MKNILIYTVLFLTFIITPVESQTSPSFKTGVIYLSKFISSEYFHDQYKTTDDLNLVDTLYTRALIFYENDYSEALLALTFACLPYKEMPIKLPILSINVYIPLPAVQDPLFSRKTKNLPAKLFYDTPEGEFGDKDKLSHFFGNAFIEYNFPLFNFSEFLGIFVEKFEESFYIQGAMDKRDLYVNGLGAKFGKELRKNKDLLPSEILKKYSYNKK